MTATATITPIGTTRFSACAPTATACAPLAFAAAPNVTTRHPLAILLAASLRHEKLQNRLRLTLGIRRRRREGVNPAVKLMLRKTEPLTGSP